MFFSVNAGGQHIILNCESQSFLINENLALPPFGESVFILSRAPNQRYFILISRSGETTLLNHALSEAEPLDLQGVPLEILWLPDSSGFLYRAQGHLYHFDLVKRKSNSLLKSDIFSDYTNLNAVWLKVK